MSKNNGERKHLSPSQFMVFNNNPMQYFHQKIEGKSKRPSKALDLGSTIHKTILEYWLQKEPEASKAKLGSYFKRIFSGQLKRSKSMYDKKKIEEWSKKGEMGIYTLYDFIKDYDLSDIRTEQFLKYPINVNGKEIPVVNYVDFIGKRTSVDDFLGEDEYFIFDLKVSLSGNVKEKYSKEMAFTSLQLRSYNFALQQDVGVDTSKINNVYIVLDLSKARPSITQVQVDFEIGWEKQFINDLEVMGELMLNMEKSYRKYNDKNLSWNDYIDEDWGVDPYYNRVFITS